MAKKLKAKSLCKFDKDDISKHFSEFASITAHNRYLCVKCARVAEDKDWLCKPKKV